MNELWFRQWYYGQLKSTSLRVITHLHWKKNWLTAFMSKTILIFHKFAPPCFAFCALCIAGIAWQLTPGQFAKSSSWSPVTTHDQAEPAGSSTQNMDLEDSWSSLLMSLMFAPATIIGFSWIFDLILKYNKIYWMLMEISCESLRIQNHFGR